MSNIYDEILSKHDLPNWLVMIITVFVIPTIVKIFKKIYHFSRISNLRISLTLGNIIVNGQNVPSINFHFKNNSERTITLSNAELIKCTNEFHIHGTATRNIVTNSYELLFFDQNTNRYDQIQIAVSPDMEATTTMPIANQNQGYLQYNSSCIRRFFRYPKYFAIRYQVRIGNTFKKVLFIY